MAKFDYTLPSGESYTVVGPPEATQEQADQVFYAQVAAGALIGYQAGQTLSGTSVDTKTFSMSRLERGTAGVASQQVLAVRTRADILSSVLTSLASDPSGRLPPTIKDLIAEAEAAAGVTSAASYLAESGITDSIASSSTTAPPIDDATITSILQHLPIVAGMPPLGTVPIENPITQADVIQARGSGLGPSAVGPLSPFQVQSIKAQTSNIVNQPYNQMSDSKGIGKFGFTCYQLEKVGYVKPTTQSRFIDPDPSRFQSVMRSPTIWTGRDDINSIDQILGDEELQNKIQQELMECGYFGLEASGVISQTPQQEIKPMQGYIYSDTGLTSNGLQALTSSGLIGGQPTAIGSLLTDYQTSGSLSNTLNLKNYYYNQTKTALTTRTTGDVGGLVANAAKYGPETTSVWATAGGINNFTRMILAGKASAAATTSQLNTFASTKIGVLNSATNPVTSATLNTPFTNLSNFGAQGLSGIPSGVSNGLVNQVTQMSGSMNLMGKAGQFATGFGDIGKNFGDLTSIDKLGDLAKGGLDKIGDASAAQITGLKGMAEGALNSVSSGFDKLAKIDLGSIGDVGKLTGLVDKAGLGSLLKNGADLSKLFGGNNALISGVKAAGGFTETINRSTVDAAVDRIIGSAKINTPTFAPGENASLGDISAAKQALSGLGGRATELLNQTGVTGFNPSTNF